MSGATFVAAMKTLLTWTKLMKHATLHLEGRQEHDGFEAYGDITITYPDNLTVGDLYHLVLRHMTLKKNLKAKVPKDRREGN